MGARAIESQNARQRPDADGYLTLDEAEFWWRSGNRLPLTLDIGKIDFGNLSASEFEGVNSSIVVNLLLRSKSGNDGLVHGRISVTLLEGNMIAVGSELYDFDMKNWWNPLNWARNVETVIGNLSAGWDGNPYQIIFTGSKKIPEQTPTGVTELYVKTGGLY